MVKGPSQTIKSILLLAGAFTFAFLLGETIHDSGHYLSHKAYGNTQVQVHFDPFGGTRIIGADGLPEKVLGVTSAAGPLPNLVLALGTFFLLWRKRRPILLPLLLWGPVAMIQEGVTFSLGLLTPGGDAQWISRLGFPQPLIMLFGTLLLVAGISAVAVLLPSAGIEFADSPRYKLFVVMMGMCSLMFIRCAHSLLITPESKLENLIPLVFSLLLAAIVVLVHQPICRILEKRTVSEVLPLSWSVSVLGMVLGASMFAFQVFVLS
jgi:hypothetical protein